MTEYKCTDPKDPEFWRNAPEEATHYVVDKEPDFGGDKSCFCVEKSDRFQECGHLSFWPKQCITEIEVIPRPVTQDGEGLPPVGTVCEFAKRGSYGDLRPLPCHRWDDGDELEVLAHKKAAHPVAVVWNRDKQEAQGLIARCLRPIRTKRERVIEAATKTIEEAGYFTGGAEPIASLLYDAGFLRNPKENTDE